ncbi:MAG: acetoacetate--CoA ligase [Planctomycetales bacterium]|nr:acetoacetate--CoA ligase [bacterium]UNM08091.1 MAG: acetoacetate--CoA ligase [Planctomycetales bacterium]
MSSEMYRPDPRQVAASNMNAFMEHLQRRGVENIVDYMHLYDWSIGHPAVFWKEFWEFSGIVASAQPETILQGGELVRPPHEGLPGWFEGAKLNFAENLLRHRGEGEAIVFWNEDGRCQSLTFDQLYQEVAILQMALIGQGVKAGDRVAGFMPNMPQTIICMLATASLGAIWSSCSPDFGEKGVIDRFGQIEPRVLFTADAYLFKGRRHGCLGRVKNFASELNLERIVVVPYMEEQPDISGMPGTLLYADFVAEAGGGGEMKFAQLPFDHPLYIMYSSGTTGLPKCMVHGAGGTLIQHLKEHMLHTDVKRGDRVFYFTTCGWMMWNWLVSALAVGATVVLFDGNPFAPDAAHLWRMAEQERLNVFGTSAKYIALLEKEGYKPREQHDLSSLRAILSTGSPLAPESFDYVYRDIKQELCLASISGGTDIISCFALGNPIAPVYRGELQTRGLGMRVEVFDSDGNSLPVGEPGELVCTAPFPSMPVSFWNDPDRSKYHAAYFAEYDNVWRHGDWVELTETGGMVIHGRSDATLNPGGVRIGTAEIYRQVEGFPEIMEALVIGQDWDNDVRIVLFVRMQPGQQLTEELMDRIRKTIRANASPYHVPKKIIEVADIPRTISGKITELAVRNIVHGRPVKNADALANPEALELYRDLAELQN